jgi:serine/threonine protein kinase
VAILNGTIPEWLPRIEKLPMSLYRFDHRAMLQTQQILRDRYSLKRILGQNAGRQTWLAGDLHTQTPVVVKLLTFSDRVQWDQVRLFEREAQVLQNLSHPQIPHYCDSFCLDDRLMWFALVQSYIPGRSLKQLLEQGQRYNEAAIRNLAKQLLNILIYLHELSPPVLHRDIKPSNLLVDKTGKLHLVDFGAVQDRAAKEGATFTIVGTYGYAPLEQLGGRATPASDLYAVGATLIHVATGVAPGDLPQERGRFQFAELVPLNPGLVRWLWRLTETTVEQRFGSAREALAALQENEGAIATLVTEQPTNSRIELQSSSQRLEIIINKPQWGNFIKLGLLYAIGIGIPLILFIRFVLLGRHGGYVQLSGMFSFWLWMWVKDRAANWFRSGFSTYLRLDHQQFEIGWRWFGLRRRIQGQIADISLVSRGALKIDANETIPAVKITVGVKEHLITSRYGQQLSYLERDWLLQTIQHWLGLNER